MNPVWNTETSRNSQNSVECLVDFFVPCMCNENTVDKKLQFYKKFIMRRYTSSVYISVHIEWLYCLVVDKLKQNEIFMFYYFTKFAHMHIPNVKT